MDFVFALDYLRNPDLQHPDFIPPEEPIPWCAWRKGWIENTDYVNNIYQTEDEDCNPPRYIRIARIQGFESPCFIQSLNGQENPDWVGTACDLLADDWEIFR